MLHRWVPHRRLDVASLLRDLGGHGAVLITYIADVDEAVEADRQQSVVGLTVPPDDLDLVLVQVQSGLAGEVIQIPDAYAVVLRTGCEILALNRVQRKTEHGFGV